MKPTLSLIQLPKSKRPARTVASRRAGGVSLRWVLAEEAEPVSLVVARYFKAA